MLSKGPQDAAGITTTAWVALLIGCFILNCVLVCVSIPKKFPFAAGSISKVYQIWEQYKRHILIEFLKC